MPLYRQKFQPYFPDPDSPALQSCEGTYCHPIQLGDLIYSQFYQTPCGQNEITDPAFEDFTLGAELVTNGGFASGASWTAGTGWSIGGGKATHTPGSTDELYQVGLALTIGNYYQIMVTVVRTAGSVFIRLGQTIGSTSTAEITESGTYTFTIPYLDNQVGDNNIYVFPSDDFAGSVDDISAKEVTYASWNPNGSWSLQDGLACHIEGETGLLEESVADYIEADSYYEIGVTVTGYISGTCDVYVADALMGTISDNGTFYYYGTPTVTGVVSFDPSSDFIGCLDFTAIPNTEKQPGLYELKNNHLAYLVAPDGTEYQIGDYFTYYERWVTLIFDISDLEVEYDCYTIKVVDACVVEGLNMVTNPGFGDSGADWSAASIQRNYSTPAGELQLVFDPIEGTDYVVNGDFATGDFTGWAAGAGWSVVGNKARHTAGSTATLTQAVTVPTRAAAPTPNQWWVQITISNRTAGSVSVTLEDKTKSGYFENYINTILLAPTNGGAVNFTITPTSDFDGDIDDISIHYTNTPWNSAPASTNIANPNMLAGNYEISFDITAQSDPLIAVGVRILGQTQSITYFDTVGTHTVQITNYVPGAQTVQVLGRFGATYGIPGTINIDNVEVYPVEPFEATYTSECLDYRAEFDNTRMVVAYCDQESFGFEFLNSGFVLQQRIGCRSLNPTYPQELQIQKSGMGNARVTYSGLEKYWLFGTDFLSETAHDTLAVQRLCDHFLIGMAQDNGVEYIVENEEYQPDWRGEGDYDLAPVSFRLRIKEGGQKFNRHT